MSAEKTEQPTAKKVTRCSTERSGCQKPRNRIVCINFGAHNCTVCVRRLLHVAHLSAYSPTK